MRVTNKDRVAHVVSCFFNCDEIVTEDCSNLDKEQYKVRCKWWYEYPNRYNCIADNITFIKLQKLFNRLESKDIQFLWIVYNTIEITQTDYLDICFKVIY